jgi:D-glycero-beta-D-manno-heptose-7-phosphate kinase
LTVDRTVLQERLVSIVKRFAQRRILVIGDVIADQFVYGGISRVSREAPVFIIRHEHTETLPGGAANCAANLAALGATVSLLGVAGDDEPGRALLASLKARSINCDGLITSGALRTTTKVRILAGQSHSTRQQVVRIDYENDVETNDRLLEQLRARIAPLAADQDAIIVSDYNYGVLNEKVIETVREAAAPRKIPVLVDSRFRLLSFGGFTSATPNEAEVDQLLTNPLTETPGLARAAEELRQRLDFRALLITRGGHGMLLLEEGVEPLELAAIGSHEPVDVTGAGDTVIATYTLALSSDASFPDAARLANYAGGLVVMKRGTASVGAEELMNSVLHSDAI